MRRLAGVLCGALWVILAGLRGGAGGLPSAELGKFATPLAQASDEANELRLLRGLWFVCSFSGHGGLAGKDELRDVGKSDGVTAGDALASKLPDEVAEEEIHFIGGSETVDVSKKLDGEDLGIDDGNADSETVGVIGAERWVLRTVRGAMVLVDQHMAVLAAGVLVLTLMDELLFRGHRLAFRKIEV